MMADQRICCHQHTFILLVKLFCNAPLYYLKSLAGSVSFKGNIASQYKNHKNRHKSLLVVKGTL